MSPSPLVTVEELAPLLQGPPQRRPTLLDVRYRLGGPHGLADYERGHLPGAAFVDLDAALAGIRADGRGGRHPMPDAETFGSAMRSAGVSNDRAVVVYDDWAALPASRAWWLLRYFGKRDVRVLDGGLAAWTAREHPTETGCRPAGSPGDFTPTPGRRRLLDATGAAGQAGRGLLLDARPADRFRGENESVDPVGGHIPGAVSAPALACLDADGRFLPPDALAHRFAAIGASPDGDVATYCGSGVQAAHLALSLAVAGITDDAGVYVGSWSDWITDPTRPVETGSRA